MFFMLSAILPEEQRSAAEAIYRKYRAALYSRAYDILRNKEDAEDAVGEAVCGMLDHIGRFRDASETDIRCQLMIYVRNAAIGIYRKKKKRLQKELPAGSGDETDMLSALPDNAPQPQEIVLLREDVQSVYETLKTMPVPVQDAVLLVCLYGYSEKEAAAVLHVSENAVALRLFKARKRISEKLGRNGS